MTSVLASVSASNVSLEEINPVDSYDSSFIFIEKNATHNYISGLTYDDKVNLFGSLIDQILSSGPEINSNIFGLISFNHDVMDNNMVINDILLQRINSITGLTRFNRVNELKIQNIVDEEYSSFSWLGNIVDYCCVLENITAYISEELVDVEFDFNVHSLCGFTLLNKTTGMFHRFVLTLKPFNNRWIPTELRLNEISDTLI